MRQIGKLSGLYRVSIKPYRQKRTLDQNSYYWAAIVTPFKEWLTENWGQTVTLEQAHDTLKLALLEVPRVQGIMMMPRSRTLDIEQFSEYIELAIEFLRVKCDVMVIPSDVFYEKETELNSKGTRT